jgi:hypothetical protein
MLNINVSSCRLHPALLLRWFWWMSFTSGRNVRQLTNLSGRGGGLSSFASRSWSSRKPACIRSVLRLLVGAIEQGIRYFTRSPITICCAGPQLLADGHCGRVSRSLLGGREAVSARHATRPNQLNIAVASAGLAQQISITIFLWLVREADEPKTVPRSAS